MNHPFNVLILEPNPEVAKMLTYGLESQFGASVFEAIDCEAAQTFLSMVSDIHLIVIGRIEAADCMGLGEGCLGIGIPVFAATDSKEYLANLEANKRLLGCCLRTDLVSAVHQVIQTKIFKQTILKLKPSDFIQTNPGLLSLLTRIPADLFIKLNDEKYVKVFPKDQNVMGGELEKYCSDKRIHCLYVQRTDSVSLISLLDERFKSILENNSVDLPVIKRIIYDLQDSVHQQILDIGVTPEVNRMIKQSMSLTLKAVHDSSLKDMVLRRFQLESGRYIPTHSIMVAEVACALASMIGMESDVTFEKLTLAALFHDVTLKSHEQAKCQTVAQFESNKEFSVYDSFNNFKLHPVHASHLVNQVEGCLSGTDQIILQHHERPDGSGFPNQISHTQMGMLSALFIMAHDFVHATLHTKGGLTLTEFVKAHWHEYDQGQFKAIIRQITITKAA